MIFLIFGVVWTPLFWYGVLAWLHPVYASHLFYSLALEAVIISSFLGVFAGALAVDDKRGTGRLIGVVCLTLFAAVTYGYIVWPELRSTCGVWAALFHLTSMLVVVGNTTVMVRTRIT